MAEKVTERKRKASESKIEGSDKFEIKITITKDDEQRAYEALDIGHRDAIRRDIYFFDTPELTLSKTGVALKARAIENADHDSVVKIRPVEPDQVQDKWREVDGFKIEADAVGDKVVRSASFKKKQKKGAIDKLVKGDKPVSELFPRNRRSSLLVFTMVR